MTASVTAPKHSPPNVHRLIGAGVLSRLVGTVLGVVLGIAATSIAIRMLGEASYGTLAFAASTGALLCGLARLGLEPAFARAVTNARASGGAEDVRRLTRGASWLMLSGGVLASLAVVAVVVAVPHGTTFSTRIDVAASLAFFSLAANVAAVAGALARGLGRMPLMEIPNAVLSLARLAALVAIAVAGIGTLPWVAAGYAVAGAATIVASVVLARRLLGRRLAALLPSQAEGALLLRTAVPYAVIGVSSIALSRFDVLVLGVTHSSVDVASYEPVLKLVEQAMQWAPLLFIGPYLPAATQLFAHGDRQGFRELYAGSSKLVFIAAMPALLILIVDPVHTVQVLYGSGYHVRAALVWVLLVGFTANLVLGLNLNALAAIGTRRILVRLGLLELGAMVVLACVLVPLFGALGAAVATSATYTILNVVTSLALYRATGVPAFDRAMFLTVGTAALPIAAFALIRQALGTLPFIAVLAEATTLWLAWLALLAALRAFSASEITRLVPRRAGP